MKTTPKYVKIGDTSVNSHWLNDFVSLWLVFVLLMDKNRSYQQLTHCDPLEQTG
jgi:hypothetical protein